MCRGGGQKPDLREGREWRPVSQWVMLLLLLNPTPSPEQREFGEQRPLPPWLLSSFALGILPPDPLKQ